MKGVFIEEQEWILFFTVDETEMSDKSLCLQPTGSNNLFSEDFPTKVVSNLTNLRYLFGSVRGYPYKATINILIFLY